MSTSNNPPFENGYAQQGPPLSSNLDRLGVYDSDSIGREFIPPQNATTLSREHADRHSKLVMDTWKEQLSLSESQRIPKSSLQKSCQYDTQKAQSDMIVTWVVFFVLASLAGIIGGLAITHLGVVAH